MLQWRKKCWRVFWIRRHCGEVKSKCLHSWSTKRQRLIKSQVTGLWHMQHCLSWNEGILSVTVELKSATSPQHLAEFAQISTLQTKSASYTVLYIIYVFLQMNLGQSQLLLNSSERFGILLAENLNRGLTPTVASKNISMCPFSKLKPIVSHVIFI